MAPFWQIFLAFILGMAVGGAIPVTIVVLACADKVRDLDKSDKWRD